MELRNGVSINFREMAQDTPGLLHVAVNEIVEAALAEGVMIPQFTGASAVAAATRTKKGPEAETTRPETKAAYDIFDELTSEQKERAATATTALAEKFSREKSDFTVVKSTNETGEDIFAVALTATERLDLGDTSKAADAKRSWNNITAKDNDPRFIIKVGGQKIDTREAQNMQWLQAIVAANPDIGEWVWRTGEQEEAGSIAAPVACLVGGHAYASWGRRSDGSRSAAFRPIIVI